MKQKFEYKNEKTVYPLPLPESELNLKYIEEAFNRFPKTLENLIDSEEEINKYQLLHPKIFDLGYNKGIESYDNCMSREHTFNYYFKYNNYKDSESNAFIEGCLSGWDDSEKEDYLTNYE